MATLKVNPDTGEYYTVTHGVSGGFVTIHFFKSIEKYLNHHQVDIGDDLPYNWRKETAEWQYIHGKNPECNSIVSSNIEYVNSRCPVCKDPVFYYSNENGSKVYFNSSGYPWEKHPCTSTSSIDKTNEINILRKISKKEKKKKIKQKDIERKLRLKEDFDARREKSIKKAKGKMWKINPPMKKKECYVNGKCKYCGKTFNTDGELKLHVFKEHSQK